MIAILGTIGSTIGTIAKIILVIITHAPELWRLILDIINMMDQIKDAKERRKAWDELNAASAVARKTGNTQDLEKVFEKWFPRGRK